HASGNGVFHVWFRYVDTFPLKFRQMMAVLKTDRLGQRRCPDVIAYLRAAWFQSRERGLRFRVG
ncbi:MAG: hypothetical protein ACREBC_27575, partial [Pyrinomonadaceae bacterium]